MTYKTISICLNDIKENARLLDAAAAVAGLFDAHVNAVYIVPAPQIYATGAIDIAPVVVDANQVFFREKAKEVRQAFEDRMRREKLTHSFIQIDSSSTYLADDMISASATADLVVCLAVDEDTARAVDRDFVERLVTSVGRPVLVLPRHFSKALKLDHVIVGWNGSRESARAAFDALPLLRKAGKAHVTVVDPQKNVNFRRGLPGAEVAETLSRHGINVQADAYPTNGDEAGHALLEHAKDVGAGLIVMGAYGHSRMREFILGGATRTMLSELDRPVLMSH